MTHKSIALVVFTLTLFLTACSDNSQDSDKPSTEKVSLDPHSYSRPDQVEVKHMKLDIRTDFDRKIIVGTVRYDYERKSGDKLILDMKNLDIHKIFVDDKDEPGLNYEIGTLDPIKGRALTIELPEEDKGHVHVMYSSRPDAAALQWLDPQQTKDGKMGFLYTQGQAILTRTWIPCQDSPGARITYDADVLVPIGMMAAMSARNPTTKHGKGQYAFTMSQPIPPYLIALAVGDFEFAPIGAQTGVYAEPSVLDAAVYEFGQMQDMLEAAEALYGKYLWERYDVLVLPPSFPFGGMENPRLTFATPTIIAGDRSLTALIAHELAHSWSGNLVTNATWNEFWLNEGFTVYFERRIMEAVYGKEYTDMLALLGFQDLEFEVKDLGEDSKDTHLHLDLEGRDPDDGMTDIAYEKGAYLLTLIEEKVGREKWDNFLRQYFDDHKFETMTTDKFVAYLKAELLTPNNVELNLDEWINGPGIPENCPVPVSDRFTKVEQALDGILNGAFPSDVVGQWTTHEWLHMIRSLPNQVDRSILAKMDKNFGLTGSGNSEIKAAWMEYAIQNGYYDEVLPALSAFLNEVGRRKFLTPLYRAMIAAGKEKDARDIYQTARPNYHSVSRNTMDKLLSYQAAG